MREIKFRAWDKERKQMLYDSQGELPDEAALNYLRITNFGVLHYDIPDMGYYGGGDWTELNGEFEIMQYTGLKDIHGNEIWEGDIIRIDHPHKGRTYTGTIVYEAPRFTIEGFHFSHHDDPSNPFESLEYMKVVGNIHEHSNLLGEEQ